MINDKFDYGDFGNERLRLNNSSIDQLLTGAVITGAEVVDFPATDGAILYLQLPGGRKAAMAFATDIYDYPFRDNDDDFYIQFCHIDDEDQ